MLLAILLPSMREAISTARIVGCQANYRAIGTGMLGYSADHFSALPFPNWLGQDVDFNGAQPGWLYRWRSGVPGSFTHDDLKTGVIYPYLKAPDVYRCPADEAPYRPGSSHQMTSYCMNGSVIAFEYRRNRTFRVSDYRADDIILWEQDENANIWNDGSNRPDERISSRHLTGGSMMRVDGSAEWLYYHEYNEMAPSSSAAFRTRLWNTPGSPNGYTLPWPS
jgi:hypothetical protein